MTKVSKILLVIFSSIILLIILAAKFVLPPPLPRQESYDLAIEALHSELGSPSVLEVSTYEDCVILPIMMGQLVMGTLSSNADQLADKTKESVNGRLEFMVEIHAERWKFGERKHYVSEVSIWVPDNKSN